MKKRLSIIILVIALLGTMIVHADTTSTSTDTTSVLKLTLQDAQARALQNSVSYQLQDSYISDALQSYYDTVDASNKSSRSGNFLSYFNSTITPEVSVDSAANSVTAQRLAKENIVRNSNFNVLSSFLKIKKAQSAVDNAKNTIYLDQMDLDSAKVKCDLGLITSDDLKTYQKTYDDALTTQDTALKNLQQEMQTLNKYIGRSITDYNIELVMDLAPMNVNDINLDTVRQAYIANSSNLSTLQQSAEVAKRKYDLTQERYDHFDEIGMQNSRQDMVDALSDAQRDYDNAQSKFSDATKDLDITLNSTYNSIRTASDNIDKLNRDIADYKTDLAKTKIKYDLGLVSKLDYEKKEMGLNTMENQLTSAIADQNSAYANLMLYVDPAQTTTK